MPIHGGDRSIVANSSPMEIAENPLYSNDEKIELLNRLKAEVTGHSGNPDQLDYEPEEVDEAIQAVKLRMQGDGQVQPTIFGGGL